MSIQDGVRSRMTGTDDPRALRTRRLLIGAYRSLLDEQAGSDAAITVSSIVERAGVTRSTFYAHFTGTGDLAAHALDEFSDAIIAVARTAVLGGGAKRDANRQALNELAHFIAQRRGTYGPLLTGSAEFRRSLVETFAEQAIATLRTRKAVLGDPRVTSRFLANGLVGVIAWWLDGDDPLDACTLASALIAALPSDFVE